jgi:hypothetical protein
MNAANINGAAALVFATIVFTAFVVIYSFRGPWWKPDPDDPHRLARAHLGYFTANLALICWVYDFRPLFDPAVFAWVRSGLFWLIAFNGAWRLWLLLYPPPKRVEPRLTEVS